MSQILKQFILKGFEGFGKTFLSDLAWALSGDVLVLRTMVRLFGRCLSEELDLDLRLIFSSSRWILSQPPSTKGVSATDHHDWCIIHEDTIVQMENLAFLLLALLEMEGQIRIFQGLLGDSMWLARWLNICTCLSLGRSQGRSQLSFGLVRLWEAYIYLLRSLAWLVNKSLCFWLICWNMLIPWCADLHVGQVSKQRLCIHFGLKLTQTDLHGDV